MRALALTLAVSLLAAPTTRQPFTVTFQLL